MNTEKPQKTVRSPIVAIMGHIDHGKSTLLSYIRKSAKPLDEAGGITQTVSAYEVEHQSPDGKKHEITFLDTPGHEAFSGIRTRGAHVADIAVLVVSAEDGVKPQTLEALAGIKASNTPYIVAINKIDKPEANIERTKQGLAENEIYIEGYGGDVPVVLVSAKTGEGVPELLDMILLVAELGNLTGEKEASGEGFVIESNRDTKKGISATCIIQNGTVSKGMFITAGTSVAPVRMMENFLGQTIDSASFSRPIKVIGWDSLPEVGSTFHTYKTRDEASAKAQEVKEKQKKNIQTEKTKDFDSAHFVPIIIKAETSGGLEAVLSEIKKLGTDRVMPKIIASSIGTISEGDIRLADGREKALVVGFNTKVDSPAKSLAERSAITIQTFDIIYKLTDWLKEALEQRTPKVKIEESVGIAKVLKIFSKVRDKQILGARVEKGSIMLGATVKIMRREAEIGQGKVRELQMQKVKAEEVSEGKEFGALIEAKIEIAQGDHIEGFIVVLK